MHIAASNPLALNSDDIEKGILDKEEKLISEELKNSGKPDEIIKKISLGKLKKFKTVGLSFSFQEIEKLPVNKFDKKLDFIITENKIYS